MTRNPLGSMGDGLLRTQVRDARRAKEKSMKAKTGRQ